MRKPLVAGNWKMNGSLESITSLVEGIKQGLTSISDVEVSICPPFVYLTKVSDLIKGSEILLGGQKRVPGR